MNKKMMLSLLGEVIKVNRGGPESRVGKLLEVKDDFFVILTEHDGLVFYRPEHVKSITLNAKNGFKFDVCLPHDFKFKSAANFFSLLGKLRHKWVKINRGGPEKVEGVLDGFNENFASIINNDEVIHVDLFHIRNISFGEKIEKQKDDDCDKKDDRKDKKDDKKDESSSSEG